MGKHCPGRKPLSALASLLPDTEAPQPALSDAVLNVERSLGGRRWQWRTGGAETASHLGLGIAQRLDVPEIVGRLLALRGIGIEQAVHYLAPTLRALLPDPSTLIDMDVAAARLARAVRQAKPSASSAITTWTGPARRRSSRSCCAA